MVRIRYSELPVGLHVTAVAVGRQTIVYLLPGLTRAERQAALLRVRSSAHMGHGPSLPAFGLVRAVAADRLRAGARTLGAAMRRHPLLLVPAAALISSLTVLVLVPGASSAQPRLTAAVTPRAAASTPLIWRAFAHYPAPLIGSHSRIGPRDQSRYHGAQSRRRADQSRGGDQSTRLGATGTLSQHQSGDHRSRHHRPAGLWHGPAPSHVGTGSPGPASLLAVPAGAAAAVSPTGSRTAS
jgi:hypothetical protein